MAVHALVAPLSGPAWSCRKGAQVLDFLLLHAALSWLDDDQGWFVLVVLQTGLKLQPMGKL